MKPLLSVKMKEIFSELKFSAKVYMRDDARTTNGGTGKIHPTKGTHWVMFVDVFHFDSCGSPTPVKVINQINRDV